MATLEHLVVQGRLKRYRVELEHPDQPVRYLYAAPAVESWFTDTLASAPCDRGRNLTPSEQVDECLYEFVRGEPLAYGHRCRKLEPIARGVWELKTTDVRIFGWFPKRATFLMVCGEMKVRLPHFKAYQPYVAHVVTFRDHLDLDDPKALTGGIRDVL